MPAETARATCSLIFGDIFDHLPTTSGAFCLCRRVFSRHPELEPGEYIDEMNIEKTVKEDIFNRAALEWLNVTSKKFDRQMLVLTGTRRDFFSRRRSLRMKNVLNGGLWALLALLPGLAHAQKTPEEYLRQQEQIKRMRLSQQIDSGVYWMDMGEYARADEKFRNVLNNIRGVPSDLAFHFGKNSHFLKQYKQSIDWLNKYIQLKGTNGQYSEEAVSWLRKSEAALLEERNREAEKTEQVLSSNYDIDCGPTGKVICPVCRGDHVIIKKAAFGDEYRTCPYCDDHGILTCDEYNLLVRGELKPKF